MVELANTDIQQHTVMIEFMYTSLAFITVSHSAPFKHSARLLHTYMLLSISLWYFTVIIITGRVITKHEVVEYKGSKELEVRLMSEDKGSNNDEVNEIYESSWQ